MFISRCVRLHYWISSGRHRGMRRRRCYLWASLQLHQFNWFVFLRLHQRVSAEQLWRDRKRLQPLHRCTLPSAAHAFISPDLIAASDRLIRGPCPPVAFSPTDIDECYEQPGICGLNTVCTNIPGTFFCSCPDGFYPSTGIFWIVGTSYCESELSRVETFACLCWLSFPMCFSNYSFVADLDEVVGKIEPKEVKPTFSSSWLRE